jgi:hypothetical protein
MGFLKGLISHSANKHCVALHSSYEIPIQFHIREEYMNFGVLNEF